jgi:pimeloyl-ACP methyl ester carboxylesterase
MKTIQVNGRDVAIREAGTGEPVVLIHGFPLTGEMWRPQLEALSSAMRVIAPDLQGFGGSTAPEDPAAYSMENWARDVAALLDHLEIDRAIVGGQSMGGYVSMAFLRLFPERVKALILADTKAAADSPEVKEKRTEQIRLVTEGRKKEVLDALLPPLVAERTLHERHDLVARVRSLMESVPPAGLVGALGALRDRPDATELLAGAKVPALLLCGAEDALTPPERMRELQEGIPGAKLAVIPGAGHVANLEAPAAFGREVAGFVASVAALGDRFGVAPRR